MGHIHAELMMQYAQDAMETPEPWERWECNTGGVLWWVAMLYHPAWLTETSYRRKPKMISVTLADGEVVSWPEPHRTELEYGSTYFYFVPTHGDIVLKEWDCAPWDITTLSNGCVHLTKEAAKQHATALRKINTQGMK